MWHSTGMQVVAGWNGLAIGALALASAVLQAEDPPAQRSFPVEGCHPSSYLKAALQVRLQGQGTEHAQTHCVEPVTRRPPTCSACSITHVGG